MAATNFAALLTNEKVAWARSTWKVARNNSFVMQFAGKGPNSPIQRITELTKSEKGAKAIITLVPDLTGDGVVGDHTLKGNEEAIQAADQEVQIDQLRNANINTGRIADQKSVITFRDTSRDVLGYWLGDRVDQMGFLTLSGVAYTFTNNGGERPVLGGGTTGRNLSELSFAADVTAPTANRHYRWDATSGLVAGDTTAVAAGDTITYAALVELKAQAKTNYVKGIKGPGNQEFYHVFLHPLVMAKLKLDTDFKNAVNNAGVRGMKNPVFTGSMPTLDGLIIHEHRHVYKTLGSVDANSKWGGTYGVDATVDGSRCLLIGAQALAMGDLGAPYWDEEDEDYNNQYGISVGKIFGLKKPVFSSEDFGVVCLDVSIR
mgnify:CR=1 FL=1